MEFYFKVTWKIHLYQKLHCEVLVLSNNPASAAVSNRHLIDTTEGEFQTWTGHSPFLPYSAEGFPWPQYQIFTPARMLKMAYNLYVHYKGRMDPHLSKA